MAFQRYRLKYVGRSMFGSGLTGTDYEYNNNTIVASTDEENNIRVISIAAHGNRGDLPYEDKCSIVAYLGMDLDREIEEYKVAHPTDPSFGDTHYFYQAIDPNKPYERALVSSDDLNDGNPPVVAVSYDDFSGCIKVVGNVSDDSK